MQADHFPEDGYFTQSAFHLPDLPLQMPSVAHVFHARLPPQTGIRLNGRNRASCIFDLIVCDFLYLLKNGQCALQSAKPYCKATTA